MEVICSQKRRALGEAHSVTTQETVLLMRIILTLGSWDSSVSIATGYGLDDRGVGARVPVGSRIFFSPRRPDRLWDPPNLLSNVYRGPFPRG
jgi:hypothetical protein